MLESYKNVTRSQNLQQQSHLAPLTLDKIKLSYYMDKSRIIKLHDVTFGISSKSGYKLFGDCSLSRVEADKGNIIGAVH